MGIFIFTVVSYIIVAICLAVFSQKREDAETNFEVIRKSKPQGEMPDNEDDDSEEIEKPDDNQEDISFEDSNAKISNEDAISIVKDAETELEFQYVLSQNSSPIVQIEMAKIRTSEAQRVLLEFPNLCGEALVEICEHSKKFNFENNTVDKWFSDAIKRTKLTAKQEIRISQCGEFVMKRALLLRENLTAAGLVELCINSGSLNLESDRVESWYRYKINNVSLTKKQQLEIARTKKFLMHKLLLLSPQLKGETLVEISENSGSLNLDSKNVWRWFEDAAKRIELTSYQQIRMVESNNFAAQRAILIRPSIDYTAFLILCQNTRNFNMTNDNVQEYFENATRKLLPTLSEEQKVKLAKTRIKGVIKGLM